MKFKIKNLTLYLYILSIFLGILSFIGCKKDKSAPGLFGTRSEYVIQEDTDKIVKKISGLDFFVKNKTNKEIYVKCFYYAMKDTTNRWQWYQTDVYDLKPGQTNLVDISTKIDESDLDDVYGYLVVFDNYIDASTATFELHKENRRIDLKRLYEIKGKTVLIEEEKYGSKGYRLNFNVKEDRTAKKLQNIPKLDFCIENKTGRNLWVTCFIYEKESKYNSQWKFKEAPLKKLDADETTCIDVDKISDTYERKNVRGYLALFEENEKKSADKATYQLTPPEKMLKLGKLYVLHNKTVVLKSENYGLQINVLGEPEEKFFEFELK